MKYKFEVDEMQKAYELRQSGLKNQEVAEQLGVSEATVSRMNTEYKHYLELEAKYRDNSEHVYHLYIPEYLFDKLIRGSNKITSIPAIRKGGLERLLKIPKIGKDGANIILAAVDEFYNNKRETQTYDGVIHLTSFNPLHTPTQNAVSRPRPVSYKENETNSVEEEEARDIITLYMIGLGYSAIRHVIGLDNDKHVEDVLRQHMLGRNRTKIIFEYEGKLYEFHGELFCPQKKQLEQLDVLKIKQIAEKRHTDENDDYVIELLHTSTWYDDPVKKGHNCCPNCGEHIEKSWNYCPNCNNRLRTYKQRKLIEEDNL